MKCGILIDMLKVVIFLAILGVSSIANAELIMIDEFGELALSSDSIEIKSRNGQKIVQGVVYGFSDGVKKSMAQFIATCGEYGGSIQIKGFEQEASNWIIEGTNRVDLISKIACDLPKPMIIKVAS